MEDEEMFIQIFSGAINKGAFMPGYDVLEENNAYTVSSIATDDFRSKTYTFATLSNAP
ncbi:hypothetical protein BGZ76_011518 [Entomortierella beljakovae]|nr:hypothetical protein BGZ76_011518 [Entomortierella beljakovae]